MFCLPRQEVQFDTHIDHILIIFCKYQFLDDSVWISKWWNLDQIWHVGPTF